MSTRTPPILPSLAALVLLAACSSASSVAPRSSAVPATTTPTAAPRTPAATATTAPTPAGAAAIPDGTYATAPLAVSEIEAKIKGDAELTDAQRTDALNIYAGHTSKMYKLTLTGSSFTLFESWDGGTFVVGARATFASPDEHTLLIQETCCGLTTFDVAQSGSGFSLRYRSYQASSAEDALLGRIAYESAPFLPVP